MAAQDATLAGLHQEHGAKKEDKADAEEGVPTVVGESLEPIREHTLS